MNRTLRIYVTFCKLPLFQILFLQRSNSSFNKTDSKWFLCHLFLPFHVWSNRRISHSSLLPSLELEPNNILYEWQLVTDRLAKHEGIGSWLLPRNNRNHIIKVNTSAFPVYRLLWIPRLMYAKNRSLVANSRELSRGCRRLPSIPWKASSSILHAFGFWKADCWV